MKVFYITLLGNKIKIFIYCYTKKLHRKHKNNNIVDFKERL